MMKQVLAMNYAVIEAEEIMIINHPTMIFTNDDVPVSVYDTEDEVNYHISQKEPSEFPPLPNVGEWCEINNIYAYGDKMVKCLQSHNRMYYAPEDTPALFLIIEPTGSDYPVWVQPTGAHDAYRLKDRVTYKNKIWECVSDYCVYAPDVFGWKEI